MENNILARIKEKTDMAKTCVWNEAIDTEGISEEEISKNLTSHLEDYAKEVISEMLSAVEHIFDETCGHPKYVEGCTFCFVKKANKEKLAHLRESLR